MLHSRNLEIVLYLCLMSFGVLCFGCSEIFDDPSETNEEVFDEMWTFIDENYSFMVYKNIAWDELGHNYGTRITTNINQDSLFGICSEMLFELKDGHTALINGIHTSHFDVSMGYEINFKLNLVKKHYLNDNFEVHDNFTFGLIQDSIGYIHYSHFKQGAFFGNIIEYFRENNVTKIILDIRNNSGGSVRIAQYIIEHLIEKEENIGTFYFKNGKNHDAFGEPVNIIAIPKKNNFPIKTNVLINRKSYSASSYLSGMVQYIDNFQLIGQITGGGGGGPISYELQNGWVISVPTGYYLDVNKQHIENGVLPDIEIENTKENIENKMDKMLEMAIMK